MSASAVDVRRELVTANRILGREGILDAYGHVSVGYGASGTALPGLSGRFRKFFGCSSGCQTGCPDRVGKRSRELLRDCRWGNPEGKVWFS